MSVPFLNQGKRRVNEIWTLIMFFDKMKYIALINDTDNTNKPLECLGWNRVCYLDHYYG